MEGVFPYATESHVIGGTGFVLTAWQAAYLVVHISGSTSVRLAILSLFALSGYFLHTVLCVCTCRRDRQYLATLHCPAIFTASSHLVASHYNSSAFRSTSPLAFSLNLSHFR